MAFLPMYRLALLIYQLAKRSPPNRVTTLLQDISFLGHSARKFGRVTYLRRMTTDYTAAPFRVGVDYTLGEESELSTPTTF